MTKKMDNEIIERLIECVRSHVFLYDLGHEDYKNITLKDAIWKKIGKELHQSGEAVRTKWKTIRDGYTKYKKHIKETTGSSRKTTNYIWSSQLSFLDNFNAPRYSSSNITIEVTPSPLPSRVTPDLNSNTSEDFILSTISTLPSQVPPVTSSPPPSDLSEDSTVPSSPLTSPANVLTASTFPTVSSHNAVRPSGNRKNDDDDVRKLVKLLNAKKRKQYDGIDHLFLSYADAFKNFPPRTQAVMKLEIAKLFAHTELQLLSNNYDSQSTTFQEIISPSPQPINISDNSNLPVDSQSPAAEVHFIKRKRFIKKSFKRK